KTLHPLLTPICHQPPPNPPRHHPRHTLPRQTIHLPQTIRAPSHFLAGPSQTPPPTTPIANQNAPTPTAHHACPNVAHRAVPLIPIPPIRLPLHVAASASHQLNWLPLSMPNTPGKLIAIEGIDGSGKHTQV